jgi:hypothetical protein
VPQDRLWRGLGVVSLLAPPVPHAHDGQEEERDDDDAEEDRDDDVDHWEKGKDRGVNSNAIIYNK